LKKVIDDVGILAIEHCLIRKLPHLFSSEIVYDLTVEEIYGLVGDTVETTAERTRYHEKLTVLEAGLLDLKRLDGHRSNAILHSSESESIWDEGQRQEDVVQTEVAQAPQEEETSAEPLPDEVLSLFD
jgi:hypothetical protein